MPEPVNAVAMNTVILSRQVGVDAKGNPIMKRIVPEIGKVFAFTGDEINQIERAQRAHTSDYIRPPTQDTKGTASVSTVAATLGGRRSAPVETPIVANPPTKTAVTAENANVKAKVVEPEAEEEESIL